MIRLLGISLILAGVFSLLGVVSTGAGEQSGGFYMQVGDWKRAVAAFRSAPAALGESDMVLLAEAYVHLKDFDHADETLRALRSQGYLSADTEILGRLVEAGRGSTDTALRALEELSTRTAHGYKALAAIGLILLDRDDERALQLLRRAADSEPEYFPAWYLQGIILERRKQWKEAAEAYQHAVMANPRSAMAHNNLGYCFKEQHYYTYAAMNYLQAIELMPDEAGFYYNLGNVYTHQERIDDALVMYRTAVEKDPSFAKAHYNLGRIYLRKDLVKEAIAEFRLYLSYGTGDIFRTIMGPAQMQEEIEQLETYVRENSKKR